MNAESSLQQAPQDRLDDKLGGASAMLPTVLWWFGLLLLAYLQFLYWFGSGGVYQHQKIKSYIVTQEAKINELTERNRLLSVEVKGLKSGNMAVEEHARLDLGLIKPGETFIQLNTVAPQNPSAPPAAPPNPQSDHAP